MRRLAGLAVVAALALAHPLARTPAGAAATAPELFYMILSPSVPPTSAIDFRRAIAYAVDRDRIMSEASAASSAPLILPHSIEDPRLPGYADASSDMYPHSPRRAREILARLGWHSPIPITVGTRNPSPLFKSIVEAAAASIRDSTGLDTTVQAVTPASAFFSQVSAGRIPIAVLGWISSPSDYGFPSYSLGIAHDMSSLRSLPPARHLVEEKDAAALQRLLLRQALIIPLAFTSRELSRQRPKTGLEAHRWR